MNWGHRMLPPVAIICLFVQLRPSRAFVTAFAVAIVSAFVLAIAFAFCNCIRFAFVHRNCRCTCLPWLCPFGLAIGGALLLTWAGHLPWPWVGIACAGDCLGGRLHGLETSWVWGLPACRI